MVHTFVQFTYCIFIYLINCAILFRERVPAPKNENVAQNNDFERRTAASVAISLNSPPKSQLSDGLKNTNAEGQNGASKPNYSARSLLKSASISASKCIGLKKKEDSEVDILSLLNL